MVSSRFVFFLSAIFIFTAQSVFAQTCFYDNGKYIADSSYEANLNHVLSSLYSNTEIDYGFYNSSYGQNPDKVSAIALCRGDVNPGMCRACLNDARSLFKQVCPNQKEAILWPGECMIRYSNRSIFGVMENHPVLAMASKINVSAKYVDQFNDDLWSLLESLRSQAVAGGSLRKFAVGNTTAPNSQTLYGLVQCTPDLSEQECNSCLVGTFQGIPQYCGGREGGRVGTPSCNIRFETYQFYASTVAASTPPVAPPPPLTNTNTTKGMYPYLRLCFKLMLSLSLFNIFVVYLELRLRHKVLKLKKCKSKYQANKQVVVGFFLSFCVKNAF
jgi:hypothetical protein